MPPLGGRWLLAASRRARAAFWRSRAAYVRYLLTAPGAGKGPREDPERTALPGPAADPSPAIVLLTSEYEYGMFEHFRRYPWMLDTYYYDNLSEVLASIEDKVISPAETKVRELSS